MCSAMDEIEQECEDAVFEVCDARERYPTMCANERARSTRLDNEICLVPVKTQIPTKLNTVLITSEQDILLKNLGTRSQNITILNEGSNEKLKNLLHKMEHLKIAAEQIRREKYCKINRLLKE